MASSAERPFGDCPKEPEQHFFRLSAAHGLSFQRTRGEPLCARGSAFCTISRMMPLRVGVSPPALGMTLCCVIPYPGSGKLHSIARWLASVIYSVHVIVAAVVRACLLG